MTINARRDANSLQDRTNGVYGPQKACAPEWMAALPV